MPAEVAVAVVSWNTRELLRACLCALRPDHHAGRADVWVVDNGSADGSRELVAREFDWVRLETPTENLGFGPAVNLVAERSSTPWLVAANADTAPRPGALAALLRAGVEHPEAGALAPRLVGRDGATEHSVHPFPTLPVFAAYNLGLAALLPRLGDHLALVGHWDPARARRVPWAVGAFLLLRRAAFDETGGFDPAQWMYAEDLDLGWRLRRTGWTTRYEPAAVVQHAGGASTSQAWGEERIDRWQRETYAWMARRRGPARARTAASINVVGALARAALHALRGVGPGSPARRYARWARRHAAGVRDPRAFSAKVGAAFSD